MEAAADERPVPIGRSGGLEALPLARADDHALVVREHGRLRALLTADAGGAQERLVVMPLDDEVEVRVDGDALAVWLGSGSLTAEGTQRVPRWASAVGLLLLLVIVALAAIGGAVVFGWVLDAVG